MALAMSDWLIRNVEVEGRTGLDVRVAGARVVEIGVDLRGPGEVIEGYGGALIPGLHDHHIHLLGLAASMVSTDVSDCASPAAFEMRVRAGVIGPDGWRRVVGHHEALFGDLDRERLDRLSPDAPARVQHQTGALWVLNSAALSRLADGDDPPGLDRATGWLWRGDPWLRARLGPPAPPPLAPLGQLLARVGITGVTDATPATDVAAADLLAAANRRGELPQHLRLMSAGPLAEPTDRAITVGEVKVLLDDHALIDLDDFKARIVSARSWGRGVAVHCVTAAELALTLAAFEVAGARRGDRIEHGGVIPPEAIPQIRELDLTVVTQPGFVAARGDRYLSEMTRLELPDAWRLNSLRSAAVSVAAGSDAPYGPVDPWVGIATAMSRRTTSGAILGEPERIGPQQALSLYLAGLRTPGGPPRKVTLGGAADLVLLDAPLNESLIEPASSRVRVTMVAGQMAWRRADH
jgi:predicted amidohydrolase YtcJ